MAGEFNVPVPDVRLDPNQGKLPEPTNNNLLGLATQAAQLRNLQNENKLFPQRQEQLGLQNQGLGISNQRAQVGLQTDQAALNAAYQDRFDTILAATQDDAQGVDALARAQAAGIFGPDPAWLSAKLGSAGMGSLRQQALMAKGNEAELRAGVGTVGQINRGGTIQSVVTKVGPNGATVDDATGNAAQLPTTLTPGEKVAGIQTVNPDTGVPERTTVGQNFTDTGEPRTGNIQTGLAPGVGESMAGEQTNQQIRVNGLQSAFEGSNQRKALLDEMRATLGEFRSGPGAAKWSGIVTEWNRVFGTHLADDAASAQAVFGKMAEMVAAQQREALGLPGTNAGAEAAQVASPNTAYSPEANARVIAQFEGNEDMLQTKQAAWQAYKAEAERTHRRANYNSFVTQFNRVYDPRFFWEQYMTPNQRATMLNSMSADQRAKYEDQKKTAMGLKF